VWYHEAESSSPTTQAPGSSVPISGYGFPYLSPAPCSSERFRRKPGQEQQPQQLPPPNQWLSIRAAGDRRCRVPGADRHPERSTLLRFTKLTFSFSIATVRAASLNHRLPARRPPTSKRSGRHAPLTPNYPVLLRQEIGRFGAFIQPSGLVPSDRLRTGRSLARGQQPSCSASTNCVHNTPKGWYMAGQKV
jgi:hypothetical protein